jgi:hypothetical protein
MEAVYEPRGGLCGFTGSPALIPVLPGSGAAERRPSWAGALHLRGDLPKRRVGEVAELLVRLERALRKHLR